MNKKLLVSFLLILLSLGNVNAYDYWWLDVSVRGKMQRVYFFKDANAFEEASGFSIPLLNWRETNENINTSYQTIFGTMRREGFVAAFVMAEHNLYFNPSRPFAYQFYLISNNKTYVAVLELSERIQM